MDLIGLLTLKRKKKQNTHNSQNITFKIWYNEAWCFKADVKGQP